MKRKAIQVFGKGLDTTSNPTLIKEGYARQSQNLLHNNNSENHAELRAGIDRQYATRPSANPVLGLYEYISNAGVQTNLEQINGDLRSWSSTTSSIDTGHQTTAIPRFAQALGFWLEADARDNNYIGNATNGYPFQVAAPTAAPSLGAVAGTSLTAGAYRYDYALYSSTTTEISPAYGTATSITLSGGSRHVTFSLSIAATEQFDQVRIYRTRVGGTRYYEVTTQTIVASAISYTDSTADAGLSTESTIHTAAGASKTDRPVGATDVVFHRGRIHYIGLSGSRSRHRWSQLNSYSFDSTTDARHDVESDDGDFLHRGFSYDGTLVLMKDNSIHLMNGDVDEQSFTWQVASNRSSGIGAYCPHTAVATPIGIIFLAQCGIFVYRPGGQPQEIGGAIRDTLDALDYSRRLLFCAIYDPCERAYIISVTPNGQTTNTESYAYFIDTGHWSKWVHGMGVIKPSAWMQGHNSTSNIKTYLGDTNGYVYETSTTTGNDGVSSGTETGTATGGTPTTITDSGAAFRTTGDGLLGISATVQSGTSSYESQEISSNTATALTTAAWTTTPASGNTYYVGAIEGILSLGRIDCDSAGNKRFLRLSFEFQSQSHSVPLLLGYTIDGDTEPTTVVSLSQSGIFRASILINRIGIGIAPYIRHVGVNHGFEILRIELDYTELVSRLPRS